MGLKIKKLSPISSTELFFDINFQFLSVMLKYFAKTIAKISGLNGTKCIHWDWMGWTGI